MIEKLKKQFSQNLQAAMGKRVNQKLVVFESDDWGGIRMPSAKAYHQLKTKGSISDTDRFARFDSLASADDLSALFETLQKHKDKNGNHPIFTFNITTANPNFEQILYSNYEKFIVEPFYQTIANQQPNAMALWRQGIQENLFLPQYHGREHIHQQRWLESLRNGDGAVLHAFDLQTYGFIAKHGKPEYMLAAYDYATLNEEPYWKKSISEGLEIFSKFFGFTPVSFIPPCYISPSNMVNYLRQNGVYALQGKIFDFIPKGLVNDKPTYQKKIRLAGLNSSTGQVNLVRNSFFEPSAGNGERWLADCLARIEIAFSWGKPAVIDTHRVNYIGSIVETNRKQNLQLLDQLLTTILKRWKDVSFITSAQLAALYKSYEQ